MGPPSSSAASGFSPIQPQGSLASIHWVGARICIWLSCLLDFLEGSHARLLSHHSISVKALCLPFLDLNPNLGLSMDILFLMFFSSFVPAVPSNRNNSGSKIMRIGQQLHLIPVPPLEVDSTSSPLPLPLSPGSLSPPRSLEPVRWTSIAYILRLSISISFYWASGLQSPPQSLTMTDHVSPSSLWPCSHSGPFFLFFPMTAFFSHPSGIDMSSLGTLRFLTFFSHLGCIIYFFFWLISIY